MKYIIYCFGFALIYYVVVISINLILAYFNLNLGTPVMLASILFAGSLIGYVFVWRHGRFPATSEKWILTLGSYVASMIMAAPLFLLVFHLLPILPEVKFFFASVVQKSGWAMLGIIFAVSSAVFIGATYFTFSVLRKMIPSDAIRPKLN